jgi:hypothetical protein
MLSVSADRGRETRSCSAPLCSSTNEQSAEFAQSQWCRWPAQHRLHESAREWRQPGGLDGVAIAMVPAMALPLRSTSRIISMMSSRRFNFRRISVFNQGGRCY